MGVKKGDKLTEQHKIAISNARKGFKMNPDVIAKRQETRKKNGGYPFGEKNTAWKGGATPVKRLIRESSKYQEWRNSVYIRDEFTCQDCGVTGGDLEVHHIKTFAI